ncbi:MAG TPA: trigger factor [Candidatus Gallacutalibacter pullicola]|mgnify:CR=1 FL=1|uniref:Trigger factor n=1 Tax=Candidatus Gallacutalibacter pullicola TaxID=2840830 RepID=A0A9D1DSR5_9FIRM|nr:trigger factor [Candidatus Gallacutalibacter pullicola]
MSLKSSNKVAENRYELEIEIAGDAFEAAVNHVYSREKKKISIPGFRKGKAPRAFIEKYYGDQVFYEDAINELYPEALEDAVNAAGLEYVDDKVDFDLISAGKDGLHFKVTITTKPEVTIDGYKGLEITKKAVNVTDEDVEEELKKVQNRNSRLVSVEDRAAEKDDIAVIDFDGSVDGVPFDGGKAEHYSLTLGAGQFIPGFEDQIIGHNIGDEFDVNVTFPEDYHAEELKGKAAVFAVKLHELKTKELPEIDDDFVKDVSEFDTLDQYKEDLKKHLTEARQHEADDDADNQMIDKIIELMKAEIPEAMYRNQAREDLREFSYRLQAQGLNMDTYMKYTGMDTDGMINSFMPQAERQVKIRLALEQIAKQENLSATEEEIAEEYKKLAENYKLEEEKVRAFIPQENLSKDLAVEKAVKLVRDSAKITEAE